ncbi:MAG: FHA domain-containing protein [Candidatus Bathyarchaeota archaeon]|nr:FHA domain-containing protein [Candidatus Bathyarchaeota archaeon]
MSNGFFLTEKQVKCENCGGTIKLPCTTGSAILTCEFCKSIYEYNPTVQVQTKLFFEDEAKTPFEYLLTAGVVIGRESKSPFVMIQSDVDPSLKQNLCIRNPFVSRVPHVRIRVVDCVNVFSCGESKRLLLKNQCTVEDCNSTNGTAVNNCLLKPCQQQTLKDGDKITLAPNSKLPLNIHFKETIPHKTSPS